ncbi:MAG: 2,3-diphosphoglycerate-dependent phosphoglycerate mutase [Bacteroidales bacterium]|nr:2,3-diphosphoglycerate-dependent phosphoglycerate mutase [Bacteroidales bacterium]
MKRIIMLRHGQSQWNLENRFTGWTDVPLSDLGRQEAANAGAKIKAAGLSPSYFFTSYLRRAIHTLQIAAEEMELDYIPVVKDWHLNERHYGALQGLNKADTAKKYGDEQVHIWRRSYDVRPPQLTTADPRYPGNDPRYAALTTDELPLGESLQDTIARVRPCWEEIIAPTLIQGHDTILIAAHGNSLRALAMMLLHLTPDQVVSLEIPTGSPWLFETDDRLTVLTNHYL